MRRGWIDVLGARRFERIDGTPHDTETRVLMDAVGGYRSRERDAQPMVARPVGHPHVEVDSVESGIERGGDFDLQRQGIRAAGAAIRGQLAGDGIFASQRDAAARTGGLQYARASRGRNRNRGRSGNGIEIVFIAPVAIVFKIQLELRAAPKVSNREATHARTDAIEFVFDRIARRAGLRNRIVADDLKESESGLRKIVRNE